ncbi:hypothetical protein [Arthrobacter sp. 92]
MPFPILGNDSDNGSVFINDYLLAYCQLARVRELVGYYRHDAPRGA